MRAVEIERPFDVTVQRSHRAPEWLPLILDDPAPNLTGKWPDKDAGLHTPRGSGAAHRFSVGMPSTFIPAMGKGIAAGSRVR
jgi:hypothetical protein